MKEVLSRQACSLLRAAGRQGVCSEPPRGDGGGGGGGVWKSRCGQREKRADQGDRLGCRDRKLGAPSNHSPFFHGGRLNGHPRARNKGWDFVSVCLLVCFFPSPTMSTTHLLSRSWSSPKTLSERDWCLQPEQCALNTDPGFTGTLHPLTQGFQHHQQPSLRGATRGSAGREGGRSAPLGEFCSTLCW